MPKSEKYELDTLKGDPHHGVVNSAYVDAESGTAPDSPNNAAARRPDPAPGPEGGPKMTEDDFEDEPAPERPGALARGAAVVGDAVSGGLESGGRVLKALLFLVLALLYFAYFGYAMSVERLRNAHSVRLLWMTCAVVFFVLIYFLRRGCGRQVGEALDACLVQPWISLNERRDNRPKHVLLGLFVLLVFAGLVVVLVLLVAMKDPYNLVSLCGICVLILSGYLGSKYPSRVRWRPVLNGLLLQFIFALLILKTKPGYEVFKFIGDRVSEFLAHTNVGAQFVFDVNPNLPLPSFAFRVLPIVIFFSTVVSVLYYLGFMQLIIEKVSWVMQVIMGTTAGESLNAAGNIFVGMTESPLIIRPFLDRMTNSELHAVMTGGFATIAGSVLGAYITFGVPANHLISASVMSAPAALAMSKLFYPETKKSLTTAKHAEKMEPSPYKNLVEAASGGAVTSIRLVANIAASLIAFLAVLEFVNQTLTWFGARAGMTEKLTFQFICSYLLWPLSFLMGVVREDCRRVAELIGVKTFLNEYIAYSQLGNLTRNRQIYMKMAAAVNLTTTNLTLVDQGRNIHVPALNFTFVNGFLHSARSEVIATYSLCGFANIGSIGILLGGLSGLSPHRTQDMASIITRAMVAGNVACFLTACIAGLLYDPRTET